MTAAVPLPHPTAGRLGQGTAVEQSRAAAEVYYRMLAAQQLPRNIAAASDEMRTACTNTRLADKAFYEVPRSGKNVTGPSVHLARELARIWGNLDYGVWELRQDDEFGQSEIQAFAWDLQTNARNAQVFIVPHKKDVGGGVRKLTSMQDIYESNANAGARRVRECIFSVLPQWFVDEAQEICRAALAKGDGSPLADRITAAVAAFDREFGVTEQQLVAKVGRESRRWDEEDVASLSVTFRSLKSRELSKDDAFPPAAIIVTAADLAPPPVPDPADAAPAKRRAPRKTPAPGKTRVPAGGAAPEAADPIPSEGPPLPGDDTTEADRLAEQIEMEAEIAAAEAEQVGRADA